MKKLKIVFIAALVILFVLFDLVIPSIMKRDVNDMSKMLERIGYTDVKYSDYNSFRYSVYFDTNQGEVEVRYLEGGSYQEHPYNGHTMNEFDKKMEAILEDLSDF